VSEAELNMYVGRRNEKGNQRGFLFLATGRDVMMWKLFWISKKGDKRWAGEGSFTEKGVNSKALFCPVKKIRQNFLTSYYMSYCFMCYIS